eukprot:CAMPEP_0172631966 /NCGR_PEP_ID=MMETSP1068-20121228/181958_1 /TAXON_ID=35684 /ORGANISM="Pseudopedinella elastica, Strain CCMP716" /LENGTH=135 /DNA_ID=CAMNT_0013443239 /DNA_START=185 /DNA_END=588 /DNA_ORIENTATION=+
MSILGPPLSASAGPAPAVPSASVRLESRMWRVIARRAPAVAAAAPTDFVVLTLRPCALVPLKRALAAHASVRDVSTDSALRSPLWAGRPAGWASASPRATDESPYATNRTFLGGSQRRAAFRSWSFEAARDGPGS